MPPQAPPTTDHDPRHREVKAAAPTPRSFAEPVASKARLREISRLLVRSLYPPAKGIRLVGVAISNLEKATAQPAAGELALS